MQGKHSKDYKKDDEYYEEDYIDDYNDVEELPKAFRKEENLDEEIPKALRKENNHEEPQRGSVEKMKKEKKRKHRKLKLELMQANMKQMLNYSLSQIDFGNLIVLLVMYFVLYHLIVLMEA